MRTPGMEQRILCWTAISGAAVTFASVNVGQRQWRTAIYFNDDFKLTPSLTFSYGFRYELDEPWVEAEQQDRKHR